MGSKLIFPCWNPINISKLYLLITMYIHLNLPNNLFHKILCTYYTDKHIFTAGNEYHKFLLWLALKEIFLICFTLPIVMFKDFAKVLWGVRFSFKIWNATLGIICGGYTFTGFIFYIFFHKRWHLFSPIFIISLILHVRVFVLSCHFLVENT